MVWSPAEPAASGLDPDRILHFFNHVLPSPGSYWVSFSGGVDSTVLLYLLASVRAQLPAPLHAIHIDHGLQTASADWAAACRVRCAELDVPFETRRVDARAMRGQGPEAAAREARYAAIASVIGPGGMLLTAHHQQDQAETVLLQMLRGAGTSGLAGMPPCRRWQQGWLARPLLGTSRESIVQWARDAGLSWIEDPSNSAHGADRNFLRHRVLPALVERWPAAVQSIARSARLCAEADDIIAEQADADLRAVEVAGADRLQVAGLCALDAARRANVLRRWLQRQGAAPMPAARMYQALEQLCHARSDAAVRVAWAGHALRRFQGQVWLLEGETDNTPSAERRAWSGESLDLGPGLGRLYTRLAPGGIDPRHWHQAKIEIDYRPAGARYRLAGRQGSRDFKHVAQELGIPPWLRDRVPVILINGQPAAIAGHAVCEPFAVTGNQGIWPVWESPF